MVSRYAERSLERRMRAATPGGLSDAFQQARMHRPDGKVVQGVIRSTFVIDEEGRVELAQYNVKATGHVAKLRKDLALN